MKAGHFMCFRCVWLLSRLWSERRQQDIMRTAAIFSALRLRDKVEMMCVVSFHRLLSVSDFMYTHTRNLECKQVQKQLKRGMWAFSLELQSSFILILINQFSEIREKNKTKQGTRSNQVMLHIGQHVDLHCSNLGPRVSTLHITHFCEETALTLNDSVLCLRMFAHLPVVLASSFFRIQWN